MQFLFADCLLDPDRRELMRGSEPIAIGPQVFDVLVYLIQNRERVVSKDALLNSVWGGRIVSESTMTSHINAVRHAIGDNGEDQRLIRTIARKGFRFIAEVRETPSTDDIKSLNARLVEPDETPALAIPDNPSIAVLPFVNLSGDPAQEYFADGVVEDIISALSRMRWLFVIARNSSFTYKGRAVDVRQVGRELGVRYVLEGSMRKAANRVRITGQLINATTGGHLWADHFDGALDDIFELQDRMTASVVGAIAPELERAEIERAKRKPTESLNAYDHYMRGVANLNKGTREAVDEALPLFHQAIRSDPGFASAYGMAAWCYVWRKINGWMTDHAQEITEGARLARRAIELGKDDDAIALTRGGHALAHLGGDLDGGVAWIDRALILNPHLAAGWYLGGWLRLLRGERDDAIEHFARAMRLTPLDPEMSRMQAGTALAHLLAGRHDAAASWAEKASRESPGFLMAVSIVAASHALAGRADQARQAMDQVGGLDPALRISNFQDWLPLRRPENLATFADGLRKAGLPE